ncbi:MAG: CHAT domain-containing protein [Bryobacterales bacterium]|nr:CHAT domain-containing protein [Bryobacterales bacterium]
MIRLLFWLALAQDADLASLLARIETGQETASALSHRPPTVELLDACRRKADERFRANQFPYALALQQAAFSIALRLNRHAQAAQAQRAIGLCYRRMGRQQESLDANLLGLRHSEQAGDLHAACELHRGAGLAQRALGLPQDAIVSLRSSAAACRQSGDLAGALRSQTNLAIVLVDIGEYREAVRLLLVALEESAGIGDRELSLALLDNLATAYMHQGDKEVGRVYLERSLRAKQAAGASPAEIALTRTNLIPIYRTLHLYEEALRTSAQILAEPQLEARVRATCHVNRAGVLRDLKRFPEAAADLEEALRLFQSVGAARQAAEVLPHIAFVYLDRNDAPNAVSWAQRAIRETQETGAVEPHRLALDALGMAHARLGQSQAARQAFDEEIRELETQRDLLAGGGQQALHYLATRGNPYYQLMALDVASNQVEQALSHLEGAKARILIDLLHDHGAASPAELTPAQARQERQLRSQAMRYAPASLQGNSEARRQWQSANRDLDAFQANLYTQRPQLRVRRAAFSPIPLPQAQSLLRARGAAIEVGVAGSKLYSFLVPAAGSVSVHVQPWEPVERKITAFRESIASRDIAYRNAGLELYRLLIQPFESRLTPATPLVLIPDLTMWSLPFAALLSPRGKHLLEERPLLYAPSLTALHALTARASQSTPASPLLAAGAPVLGSFAGTLSPLRTSEEELRQIAALYPGAATLSGVQATKERWLREAPRHRVLHLATHGVLNAANPLYSYLVFSDGVLESREILALSLNAQLAVLSACETARAAPGTGEGLVGLTWAFLAAGSTTAVASQWKVDAAGSSRLMSALHRTLRRRNTHPPQAMQRAAIELMRQPEYRHPFYWAPFLVFGSGD